MFFCRACCCQNEQVSEEIFSADLSLKNQTLAVLLLQREKGKYKEGLNGLPDILW